MPLLWPCDMAYFEDTKNRVLKFLPADSLRGRLAWGAFWSLVGAVISQGSILVASVITAHLLGPVGFGQLAIINTTIGMFGVFAGVGLGMTATKYVAEFRTKDPARAGRIIALSTAVALGTATAAVVALFAVAPWLAASTLNAPQLSAELRIAMGLLFLNALNGTQIGVLAGFEAFRTIARVNLIRGVLTLPLTVAGVLIWHLRGAVAALIAAAAVGWIVNHIAIHAECRRNKVPVRWERFWSDRVILWKFSLPAFLAGAVASPAIWAASSILVNQPRGYAEMGVFSAANQWRAAVVFLPSLLSQPLLSMLSNVAVGDSRLFRKLLHVNLLLSFGLSAFVAAPIVIYSSWIMKAYGQDFLAGRSVLILMVLAAVVSSTAAVIGQAIASLDRMWWGFILNSVWALVLLASAALLVPRYGALGLAGAFFASYLLHALTVGTYVQLHFANPSARSLQAVCGCCDASHLEMTRAGLNNAEISQLGSSTIVTRATDSNFQRCATEATTAMLTRKDHY
jgi:O-antigen/teichoic acid export membrane protein